MKKVRRKIWKYFLVISYLASWVGWIISAMCLDSDSIIPAIICLACGLWIMLITYANDGGRITRQRRKERLNENDIKEDIA